jgi:hypothetical protein
MAQFFSRYGKSAFFLGILTIITIVSSWDYPGYFSKWNTVGLPLTVLNMYLLYAAIYYVIYPSFKAGKSWGLNTFYILLCALLCTAIAYGLNRILVSQEELLALHNGIKKSFGDTGQPDSAARRNAELIGGSFVTFLMFFWVSWVLVHWHRKKNLKTRFKKWRQKQSLNTSGVHVLYITMGWMFWMFFTLSPILFTGKPIAWQTTLLMMVPSIVFFYVNLRTSFNLLADKKIVLAVVVTLCWWGVLLLVKACWFLMITKGFGMPAILDGKYVFDSVAGDAEKQSAFYKMGKAVGTIMSNSAFKELTILMASFIYGYDRTVTTFRKKMTAIAEARQKEQLQQKVMEKEVVDARLQSLKYQINPHFLFNSLNFLYSQSLPLSDELARATMLLSKMMRYGLQENSEEAKVSLAGEVEHLQNFIEFNQLRFSNQLQIDFKTEGQVAIRRIMPLLLITFVENAFKYGELHQPENPLQIHLYVDSQKLTFFVRNKKRRGPKEDSTGIGLENIRKRLVLGYPERHSLEIKDEEDFYITELTVVL